MMDLCGRSVFETWDFNVNPGKTYYIIQGSQLVEVENPTGNPRYNGYYEFYQECFLSDDESVDSRKTYYSRSGTTFTKVNNPVGNPHTNNYYESYWDNFAAQIPGYSMRFKVDFYEYRSLFRYSVDDSKIISGEIHQNINSNGLPFGNIISSELVLKLYDIDPLSIPKPGTVRLYIKCHESQPSYRAIYDYRISSMECDSNTNVWTVIAYDYMYRLSSNISASYPETFSSTDAASTLVNVTDGGVLAPGTSMFPFGYTYYFNKNVTSYSEVYSKLGVYYGFNYFQKGLNDNLRNVGICIKSIYSQDTGLFDIKKSYKSLLIPSSYSLNAEYVYLYDNGTLYHSSQNDHPGMRVQADIVVYEESPTDTVNYIYNNLNNNPTYGIFAYKRYQANGVLLHPLAEWGDTVFFTRPDNTQFVERIYNFTRHLTSLFTADIGAPDLNTNNSLYPLIQLN